jgi:SAM-dependent methyltransferase
MKKQKKVIVNLGCGKTKIPDSIGVDLVPIKGYVDKVHNLDTLPYPFKDNEVDELHMYHVLEHLHDPLSKMEELHRIMKPEGVIFMRVPHFSSMGGFTDITHIRPFGYVSFDIFEKDHYHHFYTKVEFKILEKKIQYFGLYPNSGIYEKYIHKNQCPWFARPIVLFVDFLIALSPTLFERFWCYWVGGATEVYIKLKKV